MLQKYAPFIGLCLLAAISFCGGFWLNGVMWQGKWDARDKADALAAVAAQEAERIKESQWQSDLEKVHEDGKKRQQIIADDAAELSNTVERLRSKIKSMSAGEQGGDSSIADISRSAATDKVVYSVMLESVIVRAEQYAGYADRNREAAMTCAAAYNAIR